MILYHLTTTGEISCYPRTAPFVGNLLTVDGGPTNCLDGRARAKPEVYEGLVKLLTIPGQWVFDPICGEGVCSEN